MIKVNRSIAGRLGLLVLGFALFSQLGSAAQAADEEHGNPGRFVENIRKGLSGISRFFWSPKGLSAEPQPAAETAAKKSDPVQIATKKSAPQKAAPQKRASTATSSSPMRAGTQKPAQAKMVARARAKVGPKLGPAKVAKAVGSVSPVEKTMSVTPAAQKTVSRDRQKTVSRDAQSPQSKSAALAGTLPKVIKPLPPTASKERASVKPAAKTVASTMKTAKLETSKSALIAGPPAAEKRIEKAVGESNTAKPSLAATPPQSVEKPDVKIAEKSSSQKPLSPKILSSEKSLAKQAPSSSSKKKPMTAKVDKAPKVKKTPQQGKKPAEKTAVKKHLPEVGALQKKRPVEKPVVTKKAQKQPKAKAKAKAQPQTMKKAQISKKPQPLQKVTTIPKNTSRLAKAEKRKDRPKGTYIWLPGKGSSLFARYGRSGIPASRLLASGNIERKDGRWVFAPYKAGLLPGIYGLSEQISKVGDEETWVGRGRAWIYVFRKKRTYSSFFGAKKRSGKKVAQAAKAGGLAGNSTALKKSGGVQQRNAAGKPSQLSRKLASVAPTAGPQGQVSSDGALPQKEMHPKTGAGQTVKNGNWEKKNGRWVYRGKARPSQALRSKSARKHGSKRLARSGQQVRGNLKGGWVYRNNRWIYMRSSNQKQQKPMGSSKKRGALASQQSEQKAQVGAQQKNKMAGGHSPALRSQGRMNGSQAKAMRNQKSWVRRDNRWVYASATPSQGGEAKNTGQAGKQHKAVKGLAGKRALSGAETSSSSQKKSRRMAAGTNARSRKRGQEFLFFVPGPTPGSGGWFAAPVELLRYARKVGKPEYRPKR